MLVTTLSHRPAGAGAAAGRCCSQAAPAAAGAGPAAPGAVVAVAPPPPPDKYSSSTHAVILAVICAQFELRQEGHIGAWLCWCRVTAASCTASAHSAPRADRGAPPPLPPAPAPLVVPPAPPPPAPLLLPAASASSSNLPLGECVGACPISSARKGGAPPAAAGTVWRTAPLLLGLKHQSTRDMRALWGPLLCSPPPSPSKQRFRCGGPGRAGLLPRRLSRRRPRRHSCRRLSTRLRVGMRSLALHLRSAHSRRRGFRGGRRGGRLRTGSADRRVTAACGRRGRRGAAQVVAAAAAGPRAAPPAAGAVAERPQQPAGLLYRRQRAPQLIRPAARCRRHSWRGALECAQASRDAVQCLMHVGAQEAGRGVVVRGRGEGANRLPARSGAARMRLH